MTEDQRRKLTEKLMQASLDLQDNPGFRDDAESTGVFTMLHILGCAVDNQKADELARYCGPWLIENAKDEQDAG